MTIRQAPSGAEWSKRMVVPNVTQLVIILAIVALIFGTKRLKEVGGDLGSAVKSFKKAMNATKEAADEASEPPKQLTQDEQEKK
jgi:sec-independent protein translocase protein TatA